MSLCAYQYHFDKTSAVGRSVRTGEQNAFRQGVNVLSEQELNVNLCAPKHYYTEEKYAQIGIGFLK